MTTRGASEIDERLPVRAPQAREELAPDGTVGAARRGPPLFVRRHPLLEARP